MGILKLFQKTSSREEGLKPTFNKPRHKCPFYGFAHPFGGMLIDQSGNQCPLITGSYSPCQMEGNDQTPNWEECLFNTEKNRETIATIMHSLRVAPKEFRPQGTSPWAGMPFKEWMKYVMGEEIERP